MPRYGRRSGILNQHPENYFEQCQDMRPAARSGSTGPPSGGGKRFLDNRPTNGCGTSEFLDALSGAGATTGAPVGAVQLNPFRPASVIEGCRRSMPDDHLGARVATLCDEISLRSADSATPGAANASFEGETDRPHVLNPDLRRVGRVLARCVDNVNQVPGVGEATSSLVERPRHR